LVVYPARMKRNLESTGGLVFSGQLLLDLVEKRDITRERAYRWVQRNALRAWDREENFQKLVLADKEIRDVLSPAEINRAFDLKRQLKNVDAIFDRVFKRS
jgi:adenylosuccinate lyase